MSAACHVQPAAPSGQLCYGTLTARHSTGSLFLVPTQQTICAAAHHRQQGLRAGFFKTVYELTLYSTFLPLAFSNALTISSTEEPCGVKPCGANGLQFSPAQPDMRSVCLCLRLQGTMHHAPRSTGAPPTATPGHCVCICKMLCSSERPSHLASAQVDGLAVQVGRLERLHHGSHLRTHHDESQPKCQLPMTAPAAGTMEGRLGP